MCNIAVLILMKQKRWETITSSSNMFGGVIHVWMYSRIGNRQRGLQLGLWWLSLWSWALTVKNVRLFLWILFCFVLFFFSFRTVWTIMPASYAAGGQEHYRDRNPVKEHQWPAAASLGGNSSQTAVHAVNHKSVNFLNYKVVIFGQRNTVGCIYCVLKCLSFF